MLPPGQVLIMSNNSQVENIVPEDQAGDDIQLIEGILCPGFVNTHCHIELSHMKGVIPQHTGLVEFVKQVISKREAPHSNILSETTSEETFERLLDEKLNAMTMAVNELYDSGTVAVGDICNTADSIELKKNSPLYWHNFIEITGFVDAVAEKRVKTAEEILNAFIKYHPHLGHSLTPHSPYSVSKTLFKLLNEKTADQIISIHNQEAVAENELYQQKSGALIELYNGLGINLDAFAPTGKTSMKSWLPYFNKRQKVIAVHNTFTSEDDIKPCDLSMAYCICINANLYIENKLPPIEMLIKNDCSIVLGTDSYASNYSLNMMEEINSIQKHFPSVPLATILQWGTINGAKALGIEDGYGSFEKGKTPGLVLIDIVNGVSKKMV